MTPHPGLSQTEVDAIRTATRVTISIDANARGATTGRLRAQANEPLRTLATIEPRTSLVDYGSPTMRRLTAHATLDGSSEPWRTIANLAKEGDHLELVLAVDAGNQYLARANLHCDRLSIRIHRPGEGTLFIPLIQTVAPDNVARLVQR